MKLPTPGPRNPCSPFPRGFAKAKEVVYVRSGASLGSKRGRGIRKGGRCIPIDSTTSDRGRGFTTSGSNRCRVSTKRAKWVHKQECRDRINKERGK